MRLLRNNAWNGVPSGGFPVSQGGTKDLVGISEDMKNTISGVPVLDAQGMVKPGDVPIAYLSYTPNLEGPKEGILGASLAYTITNYSFIRDYVVSMETGTIERNKDKIYVTPNSSGDHVFSVNNRSFLINILSGTISKPHVVDITTSSQQSGGKTLQTLYLKGSDFSASRISETHISTRWVVATDVDFNSVIADTVKTDGNLHEVTLEIGDQRPVIFIKTMYNGRTLGSSPWSDAAKYAIPKTISGATNGDMYGVSVDCSAAAEKIIVGVPGLGTTEEVGSGAVSILRNTGTTYIEEISFGPRNQSASVSLTIPTGGSVRIALDSTPPFDQTFTSTQVVSIPNWGTTGTFYGKGGPGTQYWVPPTPDTPGTGQAAYPTGLPRYVAATFTPQQGNPSYPSGLSAYQASYTIPAQGNASYPNGLPLYVAPVNTPAQGNPNYPSGLPAYVPRKLNFYEAVNNVLNFYSFSEYQESDLMYQIVFRLTSPDAINWTFTLQSKTNYNGFTSELLSSVAETVSGTTNVRILFNTTRSPEPGSLMTQFVGPYQGNYTEEVGISSFPNGLPPYQPAINIPQQGNPSYPNGLPSYQAPVFVPQVGNSSYPSGLPAYVPANSTPQVGLPAYPNGLPAYVPDTPGLPGYYADALGTSTSLTIQGKSLTFASGFGNTPAVTVEKRIYANSGDSLGSAVAISKNFLYAVAGAPLDEYQNLVDAGSCYAIPYGTNRWADPVRLAQPIPKANANFGTSVDINQNGQVIFVGSPGENAVHVYRNNAHVASITIPGIFAGSKFGSKVSCSDDGKTVAISSPIEPSGSYQGKVYVFKENPTNVWSLIHTLTPNLAYESVVGTVPEGATLSIEQRGVDDVLISTHQATDTIAINASTRFIRLSGIGSAVGGYNVIGIRDSENPFYPSGTWGEDPSHIPEIDGLEVFPAFDDGQGGPGTEFTITYAGGDYKFELGEKPTQYDIPVVRSVGGFGSTISLSGDGSRLAVGAPSSRIHIDNQGFVSLYTFGTKASEQKLISAPVYGGFFYGKSVSVSSNGNTVLITEPGRNAGTGSFDTWTADEFGVVSFRNKTKPDLTVAGGGFGTSSAISSTGEVKVFANPMVNSNRGAVYVL